MTLSEQRAELIDAIIAEIERVWVDADFSGGWGEYEWLETNYGVTLEDDTDWIGILNFEGGVADPDDPPEWYEFVEDDARVIPFLENLLQKYRSNDVIAPANIPHVVLRIDFEGNEIREERPTLRTDVDSD